MADIDKLIAQYGGSIVPEQKPSPSNELADLAAQFGGTLVSPDTPTTPGGYGAGTFAKDMGKLTAAGAVPGVLGAPEAVESAIVQQSKSAFTAPTDILGYLSSPDKLANKFVTSLGFKPIFGEETKGLVPEEIAKKQEMLLDEVRAKGKSQNLKDLSAYGQKLGRDITETASPEIQLAMANFVPTGSLNDIAQGKFENFTFGAKPTFLGFAGQFANVFGSVAPGMLGTIVTKDPKYMQVFGFGQAGSEGVNNAREYIQSLNDNQLSNNSPYFQDLLRAGYDSKTARAMTEEKAVDAAATAQGVVGALGGEFTAKLITGKFDKVLLSSVKNRALNIVGRTSKGLAIGAAEEGIQEAAEGIASDLGINKTVVKEIGADVFADFVLGAIGGGGIGGVKGLLTKDKTVTKKPTPDELFADLIGTGVPPTAPPAAPVAGVPPTVPPTSPAAPEAEVELEPPVPSSVLAPVAAMVSTVGLDPATAQRVDSLKAELKLIDSRKTDPTSVLSESDLEFLNEREAELAKEITDLVSPKTPEPTAQPTTAEKLDNAFMWRKDGVDIPIQVVAEKLGTNENGQREILALVDGQEQSIPIDQVVRNPNFVAPVSGEVVTEPEAEPTVAQIDKDLIGKLQEFGQPIESRLDAESRFSNGEQIYAFPEQDEQPLLIQNIDELSAYPPDRLLALPAIAPVISGPTTPEVTKEEQIAINKARQEDQLKAAAETIGNDKNLLEKRLKEAKSVLTNEYQEKFKNPIFDFEKKQLASADGTLALQWENNGKTNQGDVKVISLKEQAPKEEEIAKPIGGPAITTGGPSTPKKVAPTEEEKKAKEEEKKAKEEEKKAAEEEKAKKEEQKKKIAELNTNPMKIAMETGNADAVATLLYGHAVDENLHPVIFPEEMLLRIPVETNLVSQIEEKLTEN
jgi:hypothetical protein